MGRTNAEDDVQIEAGNIERNEQEDPSSAQGSAHSTPNEEIASSGRFRPGNTAALRHGLRSQRVTEGQMAEQAEALEAVPERIVAIVAGLGGEDQLSPLALGEVKRHAKLELIECYCWSQIEKVGPFTAKGRTRAAVTLWLQVHDRLAKSAQALGLERRAKRVASVQELLS